MRGLLLLVVVAVAVAAVVIVMRLREPAPPPPPPVVTVTPDAPWWSYAARGGTGLLGFALAGPAGGNLAMQATARLGG